MFHTTNVFGRGLGLVACEMKHISLENIFVTIFHVSHTVMASGSVGCTITDSCSAVSGLNLFGF